MQTSKLIIYIRQILRVAVITSLFFFSVCCWLVATNSGLNTLVKLSNLFYPIKIYSPNFSGSLVAGIKASQLQLEYQNRRVYIEQLALDVDSLKLFQGQITLQTIKLKNIVGLDHFLSDYLKTDIATAHLIQSLQLQLNYHLRLKQVNLQLEHLSATWQDQPIFARTHLKFSPKFLHLSDTQIVLGKNKLTVETVNENKIKWLLAIQDPEVFLKQVHGKIQSEGTIENWQSEIEINGFLKAQAVQFFSNKLDDLNVIFNLAPQLQRQNSISLKSSGLYIEEQAIDHLDLQLFGTLANHELKFTLNAPLAKIDTQITGSQMHAHNWQGQITQTRLNTALGNWQQTEPTNIKWQDEIFSQAAPLALVDPNTNAKILNTIDFKANNFKLLTEIQQFPLNKLAKSVAEIANFTGHFDTIMQLSKEQDKDLQATTIIKIPPGKMKLRDGYEQIKETVSYEGGTINLKLKDNNLSANWDVIMSQSDFLRGNVKLKHVFSDSHNQPLQGEVNLHIAQIAAYINDIYPLAKINGGLQGKVKIAGSASHPYLSSDLQVKQLGFTVPEYGTGIENTFIQISSNDYSTLQLNGSGHFATNQVPFTLQGKIDLKNQQDNFINFTSKQAMLVDHPAYQLIGDPDLQLKWNRDKNITLSGKVHIHQGKINLENIPITTTLSDDVRFVDTLQKNNTENNWQFIPNLTMKIDSQVYLTGFGFNTTLGGNLTIYKQPQWMGDGRITIKQGTYKLAGQTLHIDRGRLLYPPGTQLTNPDLDIKLLKSKSKLQQNVENQGGSEAGFYVRGNLEDPIIENLGFISKDTQKALQQALSAGTGKMLGDLQNKLGIDELGVDSVEGDLNSKTDSTVLVIGKKLSDRLYLQYVKSILESSESEPINSVRLKYKLSKVWDFGIESGTQGHGADLRFTVEN